MTMLLRNNVTEVIRHQELTINVPEMEYQMPVMLLQRIAKLNHSQDAKHIETVLVVPEEGKMYLLAVSEAFHKIDVDTNSRNLNDSKEMAKLQWASIIWLLGHNDIETFYLSYPILKESKYFDILADAYEIAKTTFTIIPMMDAEGVLPEPLYETRWIVYGFGNAWDFGSNEFKAKAHLQRLTGSPEVIDPDPDYIGEDSKIEIEEETEGEN